MSVSVPEEAIEAARVAVSVAYEADAESDDYQIARAAVGAAAPLILAAELERLSAEYWSSSHVHRVCKERASVLRGEGASDDRNED